MSVADWAAYSHPTPCPPWCKDRLDPLGHVFGPTSTAHWSPQVQLLSPLDSVAPVLMRAQLYRGDEGPVLSEPVLYLQGETDVALSRAGADVAIARLLGFTAECRVLRRQMG